MSEPYPFYSEEDDAMSKREQLEGYFSQSLEVDTLLRLCPDDEDTIYQIVDLLVDTCAMIKRTVWHWFEPKGIRRKEQNAFYRTHLPVK